jgi:hypothetical protein
MAHFNFLPRTIFVVIALVSLSACVGVTAVGPGPVEIGKSYRISTGEIWSKYPPQARTNTVAFMTIDGTMLNTLSFVDGLQPGQSIIYTSDRDKLIPKYRVDMSASELVDFVLDSYAVQGLANGKMTDLRPEKFGPLDGYRFDFTGAYNSGLELTGTGKIAQQGENLHIILFYAPSEYYYGLRKDEVDGILASVSLL